MVIWGGDAGVPVTLGCQWHWQPDPGLIGEVWCAECGGRDGKGPKCLAWPSCPTAPGEGVPTSHAPPLQDEAAQPALWHPAYPSCLGHGWDLNLRSLSFPRSPMDLRSEDHKEDVIGSQDSRNLKLHPSSGQGCPQPFRPCQDITKDRVCVLSWAPRVRPQNDLSQSHAPYEPPRTPEVLRSVPHSLLSSQILSAPHPSPMGGRIQHE